MSTIVEIIPNGNNPIPVMADDGLPLDLLNRQEIIDQISQLLNIVSDSKSSCTFALNGIWGSGKTFVLNRLMKQLLDYQDGEKFLVCHYNCWQYDYYEEPLIAIVAAMLDSIDQENHVFSKNLRDKARQGMAAAKPVIEKIATDFVKQKIGIDITDLISFAKGGQDAIEELREQEELAQEFDKYYSFKKAIETAQSSIRELSKDRTLIIIVDELDRCLPSYAIKVLERLHHLFANIENVAIILAVDKTQLNTTVAQIFGKDTDASKYLKKFINFEIQLDTGRIAEGFFEKYADYTDLFDGSLIETNFSFEKYFSAIFAGIDVRTQERIIDRLKAVHKMMFPYIKKDYAFMCMEVMWVIFTEYKGFTNAMPITYDGSYDNRCFTLNKTAFPEFNSYLHEEWIVTNLRYVDGHGERKPTIVFPSPLDIPQLLIWYLWQLYPNPSRLYQIESNNPKFEEYKQNLDALKKLSELLKIIK